MIKDKYGRKLSAEEAMLKIFNRLQNWLLDAKLLFLTWVGLVPFHSFRILFYRFAGLRIGRASRIHIGCRFYNPRNIIIGADTIVGDNAFLDGREKLIIGNHVSIASGVWIYNSQHDIDSEDFHAIEKPVTVDDYVFIGPRSIILPGVKIGYGAVVGAGAVVTSDVLEKTVVGGVPARLIRKRKDQQFHYRLGRARLFQ